MSFISRKLFDAMRAVFAIAYNGRKNNPVSGAAIVAHFNLGERALEPVLQKLSRAGIVESVKGAHGGYYIPRPESVTLRDVMECFIESVVPEKNLYEGYANIVQDTLEACYREQFVKGLEAVTLEDLCRRARETGLPVIQEPVLDFSV